MSGENETRVDLLRHGEPLGGSKYRGQVDDPLSERGWQQMWAAVENRDDWDRIVTSSLARCREFAEQLGERRGIPVVSESQLVEVGFGTWEGKSRAELEEVDPGQVTRFYQDPIANRPEGAEPLDAFTGRVQAAFVNMLETYPGESLLVVAHAGVIRAIIAHVLEIPAERMYRIHVKNAGITSLKTCPQRGYNFVSHSADV
jgi:alpha-ribazole phosphatase/probable phosphoglycerate mutase